MNQSTAILFFSRTPAAEAGQKSCPDISVYKDLQVKTALINHTLRVLRKTNLPFYYVDEHLQRGASFGERLANAFEFVFGEGFDRVIAVGNDCPSLKAKHILAARESLFENSMILAKDSRGGVSLLGMRKSVFVKKTFIQLRWQTKFLFSDLQNLLPSIALNGIFRDINTKADMVSNRTLLGYQTLLYRLFNSLILPELLYYANERVHILIRGYSLFPLRAPPASFIK